MLMFRCEFPILPILLRMSREVGERFGDLGQENEGVGWHEMRD
jgi:hypothetical protein